MRIVRWEPFREIEAMQNEMRRLLGQTEGERGGTWMPPVDVSETERELVLSFDLPGISQDEINVELDDGTLTISGERQRRQEEQGEGFYRVERRYGGLSRSIPLPPGVDEEGIRADYRDGVLDIRVPKPQQPQPRRITIGGGGEQQQEPPPAA